MCVSCTANEVFPLFFLSCKANTRLKLAKTGHGPHSSRLVVICVALLLFVLFYVLFMCKCVLYHCHRVLTQLQLTNISCIISHNKPQKTKPMGRRLIYRGGWGQSTICLGHRESMFIWRILSTRIKICP